MNVIVIGSPEWGTWFLHLALAVIFFRHGFPKLKGGLPGFKVLGVLEMVAAICMVFDIYVQIAAYFMCFVMLGAIYFKIFKWKLPFWSKTATGWEFDFIIFFAALSLAL